MQSHDQQAISAPAAMQYVTAFRGLANITPKQKDLLKIHYWAPGRNITASQMASRLGYDGEKHQVANSQYGRLARLVGEALQYHPTTEQLGTLVKFERRNDVWHWFMRPEVAEAIEILGWTDDAADWLTPEEYETADQLPLREGKVTSVYVNSYERNPKARRLCIQEYGAICSVCDFDFEAIYGELARGYIHVHHLNPLSEMDGEYDVDPIEDLRPVCPNCHAVLHLRNPAYRISEVRKFLRRDRT